jgi:hypothetical protein
MTKKKDYSPKRILAFDNTKKFCAIYASDSAAARTIGISPSFIRQACEGKLISLKSKYWRYASKKIEIEDSDFETLTVVEYDELCGVQRKVYPDKYMRRTRTLRRNKIQQNK